MSQFTPRAGNHFYVKFKPFERIVCTGLMDEKVVMVQDNSYRDYVFECIATDDTHVVAKRVWNCFGHASSAQLFVKDQVTFMPVGPDVLDALGIEQIPETL